MSGGNRKAPLKQTKKPRCSLPPEVPHHLQSRRSAKIRRDFLVGVLLAVFLIVTKDFVEEKTRLGMYLEGLAADWLQSNLAAGNDRATSIVIFDTSEFAPTPEQPYTPR